MMAVAQFYPVMKMMTARVIAPFLLFGGLITAALGVVIAAAVSLTLGLILLASGVGGIALAQIIELLKDIENDLAAIRARMDAGVLGLLPNMR
jgi:hypothetical protein